jgi:hypothetical protein
VDKGRKRVLAIGASILAARKLALFVSAAHGSRYRKHRQRRPRNPKNAIQFAHALATD